MASATANVSRGWPALAAALCLSFTVAGAPRDATAQSPPERPQPIVARVSFVGAETHAQTALRAAVTTRRGMRLDPSRLQRDLRALWQLGGVRNIEVSTTPTKRGRVVVRFHITASPVVSHIRVLGAGAVGDAVARRALKLTPGKPLAPVEVKQASLRLRDELVWQGYPDARVLTETRPAGGGVILTFRAHPGKAMAVRHVRVVGNRSMSTRDLLREMNTSNGTVNSRGGILVRKRLEDDTRRMLALYYKRGFVTAMVFPPALRRTADGAHVDIVVRVREGKPYKLGDLSFSGRLHGSAIRHRAMVSIRQGQRFNASRVAKAVEDIRRYYRRAGYPAAAVEVLSDVDRARGVVALEIRVTRKR